jgi:hypothetical protein
MIDRRMTPSSWLLERLYPDTETYGFLQPVMILGLKAIEALACMESITLSSLEKSAAFGRSCLAIKAFSSYCYHLKEESSETHFKITKFIQHYFQSNSLYWPYPSLEYEKFIQKVMLLSAEETSLRQIKEAFKAFFSSCDEEQAFELVRVGNHRAFNLEQLIERLGLPDDVELKEHFLQECVNFSFRSLNFLKGFLFFIYNFEERLIIDTPIGISLRNFYQPYLEVITLRRHWVDGLIGSYPKSLQITYRDQFIGFVQEACHNHTLSLIRATKDPSRFFSPHDVGRWLIDASLHEIDIEALFQSYLVDPKGFIRVFQAIGTLDLHQSSILDKRLRWVRFIQLHESGFLQKRSVLGHFVLEKSFDKIWDYTEQLIYLASIQTDFESVCFLDVWHQLFNQQLYINPKTFNLNLEKKGRGQIQIRLFEYLLLLRGKELFTKLKEFFDRYGIDERIYSRYVIALMQSSTYAFELKSIGIKKIASYGFSKKNRLQEPNYCQLNLHPLLLILIGKKPELSPSFLQDLILDKPHEDLEALAYFDPYYFDSMGILTALYDPFSIFSFSERALINEVELSLFQLNQLDQIQSQKKEIFLKLTLDPDRFMQAWLNFVRRSILIASRHGINHLPSCHITNEICNIPYVIKALKDEEIHERLFLETKALLLEFTAKEELNVHEQKVFPFLKAIIDYDLSPFTEKFHLENLQLSYMQFLTEFQSMPAGPLKMVQDYYVQKKWENTLAFYFPEMPFEMVLFLYHQKRQMSLILQNGHLELHELEKAVLDHEKMIAWCATQIDDDELKKALGFNGISHFVQHYFITKENVVYPDLRAFFDLPSMMTVSDLALFERAGLVDCYQLIKRIKAIDGVREKSYLLPSNLGEELPDAIAQLVEKKGKIAQKIDQIYLPFMLKFEAGEVIQHPVGDFLGLFQEIANLGAFGIPLLVPFKTFSAVVEEIPTHELKTRFRASYVAALGGAAAMPSSLKERIRTLFDQIKAALETIDPVQIGQLVTLFEGFDFINLEDPTEGRVVPYVVASSILDDSGAPMTKPVLIGFLRNMIQKVLRRDHHLAVPEDRKEKKAFFDKIERMLFRLKKEVQAQMESLEKLDLVGPMLTNVAIAGSHCATRWTMEIEGAIEALSVEADLEDFESLMKKVLYQSRKQIVMNFLELAFQPEVSAFGIEALIHPFNYIRAQYAHDLGLPILNEGLVLEEQAEDIETRLEEFSFFKQVEQALIKQLFKILYFFPQEAKEKRIIDQALIDYVIESIEEGRNIPGLEIDEIDEDALLTDLQGEFLETITRLQSLTNGDLKSQSQAELGLMDVIIEYFHKAEGKAALIEKEILIPEQISAILAVILEKNLPEPMKLQLQAGADLIVSSELEASLMAHLGDTIDESIRQNFIETLLSEPKLRHAFLDWVSDFTDGKKTVFFKYYYERQTARILPTIFRKLKALSILPVFPYDPYRSFFPAWVAEKPLLDFLVSNFVLQGSGIDANRTAFFGLREQTASLALKFQESQLENIATPLIKELLQKGLNLTTTSLKKAALRIFLHNQTLQHYQTVLHELFSERPTMKANVLYFKLVDEDYLTTSTS